MMKEKNNFITGIILAGGKSSRMGYDKGLAETKKGNLIDISVSVLKQIADEIIIIANTSSYDYLGLPVYEDLVKECGPLGGIYTGLFYSKSQDNIIVACDMPFISVQLLNTILKNKQNKQVVVPAINNKTEPLCGYYNSNIKKALKVHIDAGKLAVHSVIEDFDHLIIPFDNTTDFMNVNTPEDLQKIK